MPGPILRQRFKQVNPPRSNPPRSPKNHPRQPKRRLHAIPPVQVCVVYPTYGKQRRLLAIAETPGLGCSVYENTEDLTQPSVCARLNK